MDDIMNMVPENHDFDEIKPNSTTDEKLNAMIALLGKSSSMVYVEYEKLFIPIDEEPLFNALLNKTGFAEQIENQNSTNYLYEINSHGRIMLSTYGSYMNYITQQRALDKEINEKLLEDAELDKRQRKIDLQNAELQNEINVDIILDYPKEKKRKQIAYLITIVSTLLLIGSLIIAWQQYLKCK